MEDIPLIDPPVQSMVLPDGRNLTWQEFGTPEGRPTLYFHGGGSFSLEAGIFHREAVHKNLRLISTNRPGAGGSDLCPGRPVAAYSDDLNALLDHLEVDKFACFGESNGGMVTLAVAATMSSRVVGAMPINPTVPWFDPMARRVTSGSIAIAYRMMKYAPWVLTTLAPMAVGRMRKQKEAVQAHAGFHPVDLLGPPPGTEPDVGELQWRVMENAVKPTLKPEMKWASSDWGFDLYSIPVPLDFFCGAYDAQAPFALVLANRNPDARFHYYPSGHNGFSHPDARRRITDLVAGYFDR